MCKIKMENNDNMMINSDDEEGVPVAQVNELNEDMIVEQIVEEISIFAMDPNNLFEPMIKNEDDDEGYTSSEEEQLVENIRQYNRIFNIMCYVSSGYEAFFSCDNVSFILWVCPLCITSSYPAIAQWNAAYSSWNKLKNLNNIAQYSICCYYCKKDLITLFSNDLCGDFRINQNPNPEASTPQII